MEALKTDDPTQIGGYRLLGRLGEGGMGRVYLARSDRGRTVAVKVVQAELARQPDFRKRFAQEVRAARQVGDQWTAPVLDADTDAETPWVATGYVAGPSLAEVVGEQYGPLPETSVRALALGLVRALQAIHTAGLVHRDLKPSNVLVTIEGPRVIDFGIARALDAAVQSAGGLTRTGALVGSPGFMSPEQVRGQQVTPASDVFCLGTVLAYTATGRLPFGTADSGLHALLFRVAEEDADLEGIPQPWHGLIAACLAKDPEQRPTVDALLESIEATEPAPGADLGQAWLPAAILARLGQHAVALLDSEDPESPAGPAAPGGPGAREPAYGFGPPMAYEPAPWPGGGPQQHAGQPNSGHAAPGQPHTPHPHAPLPGQPQVQQAQQAQQVQQSMATVPPHMEPRSPRVLARVTSVLLGSSLVVLLVHGAVLTLVSYKLESVHGGVDDLDGYDSMQLTTLLIESLHRLLFLATAVLWLGWFRRVRLNAETLSPGSVRYPVGMAIGSWLIPVANFFMPKQIANDVWAASGGRSRGLLNAWWWTWIPYAVLFLSIESNASWYDAGTVQQAEIPLAMGQAAVMVYLAVSILALILINRLTSLQHSQLSNRGSLAARS